MELPDSMINWVDVSSKQQSLSLHSPVAALLLSEKSKHLNIRPLPSLRTLSPKGVFFLRLLYSRVSKHVSRHPLLLKVR